MGFSMHITVPRQKTANPVKNEPIFTARRCANAVYVMALMSISPSITYYTRDVI